ncbi:sensor histidine kinase [Spirosoma utsteinense]|uniref:histidine kinase n=1 Tax=Spirosoma utsteinense TaxID=2585773 RepID=A0ABR6WC55_9BACT|nr:HAMP domain-containing sensor histidine kinase [Spirosoma utsteinense]MBC3784000.1 signal transduction histidine kinase [Spirosoma utsteinense]MBC3793512.1 signal transduction histidine kinase [Spirosoma utsteinense]
MNIRTRLTLLFVLLVASILLLFTVSVYYLYDQFRQQEFQQRLEEKAFLTVRLREDVGEVPRADLPVMADEQVTIYNERGAVLYNQESKRPRFSITPFFLRTISLNHPKYLRTGDREAVGVRYVNARKEALIVVASGNDRYGFSKLDRLREILFSGWLLSLAIVGIAGYLFATDALRPVAELIKQVNAISATNIHMRLHVGRQRDELAYLARTFNDLLSRLEEAFVSQRSFVSHASHELRTPLTVMMGQIEVTRLHARSTGEYEQAFDALLDEVKSMIRLVNSLLELARASSDATTLHYLPTRLDELLWQAQSQLVSNKPACQIDIDFVNLPDQEEDLLIMAEESLLQTAFLNLMENGCKYSANGRVSVRIAPGASQLQVTVSDTGSGISTADLPHIFEPFYRSNNTMTINGHGIGLALTHRIIQLHRGHISVESVVGKGTTFRVTLPVVYRQPASSGSSSDAESTKLPDSYNV